MVTAIGYIITLCDLVEDKQTYNYYLKFSWLCYQ